MSIELTKKDLNRIHELVVKLIGTEKIGLERADVFVGNIKRRMFFNKLKNLDDYLLFAKSDKKEFSHLISSLTVHTTFWMREKAHFQELEKIVQERYLDKKIEVLSAACSTGEEVYSIALTLEAIRSENKGFDYKILGLDIDPISIEKAENAIYGAENLGKIPLKYHKNVLIGSGRTQGKMTLSKDIRSRCQFTTGNLLKLGLATKYQIIFCRNSLIYFTNEQVDKIAANLEKHLLPGGHLILGHSESIGHHGPRLSLEGRSIYSKNESVFSDSIERKEKEKSIKKRSPASQKKKSINAKISKPHVLVVDDSKTIRGILDRKLSSHFNVYLAEGCDAAEKVLAKEKIDIISLDVNMPGKDGITWLSEYRKKEKNMPIVLLTDASLKDLDVTLNAVEELATDFIEKSVLNQDKGDFCETLLALCRPKEESFRRVGHVLVVDDDQYVAELIGSIFEEMGFQVTFAYSGVAALEVCKEIDIHMVVTDYKMPLMDGLELSQKLYKLKPNLEVNILTGHTFLKGETKNFPANVKNIIYKPINEDALQNLASDFEPAALDFSKIPKNIDLLLIGASTGGPNILSGIFSQFQGVLPPVVLVQHLPYRYQHSFGERLSRQAGLELVLVTKEEKMRHGCLYFPGMDAHVHVFERNGEAYVTAFEGQKHKGHRPAVDNLFMSGAESLGSLTALAILLTGMGSDGAAGLLKLKEKNHITIAQDRTSSVVFGMPKAAIDMSAAQYIMSDSSIRALLLELVGPWWMAVNH